MRFTENGLRDSRSGGGTGIASADPGSPDYFYGMTINSNGGVVLSGRAGTRTAPARNFFLATFDVYVAVAAAFGINGQEILNTNSGDEAGYGVGSAAAIVTTDVLKISALTEPTHWRLAKAWPTREVDRRARGALPGAI